MTELNPRSGAWQRCPGSKQTQMLAWVPDDTGYPGAVVCLRCTYGVLVVEGSAHEATSMTGVQGMAGTVRVHQVRYDPKAPRTTGNPELVGMRYPPRKEK